MNIVELFGKAANCSLENALKTIKITKKKIESSIKKQDFIIKLKDYDVVVDYKPKINFLNLYLCQKKYSKKLLKSINPNTIEFKSFVVRLGGLKTGKNLLETRLGAYGFSSSELGKAMIKGFRKK